MPARGKRVRGGPMRHYGSVRRLSCQGGTRPDAGLPDAGTSLRRRAARCKAGYCQHRWCGTPLPASEYNRRRAECEEGAAYFGRSLRDVTLGELQREGRGLPDNVYRRCRHVITENARAMAAAEALEQEDLRTFGELMAQSHRSLRDDYQVSCAELDTMVEIAAHAPGVYGSRMTGGGFGGCTISLVQEEHVEAFSGSHRARVSQGDGAGRGCVCFRSGRRRGRAYLKTNRHCTFAGPPASG